MAFNNTFIAQIEEKQDCEGTPAPLQSMEKTSTENLLHQFLTLTVFNSTVEGDSDMSGSSVIRVEKVEKKIKQLKKKMVTVCEK